MQIEIQLILWASFRFTSGLSLEKIICEGDTKTTTCYNGQVIAVTSAYYGRKSYWTCWGGIIQDTDCSSGEDTIRNSCDGQTSCELTASNSFFGSQWNDPCPRTSKYVYMEYECQATDIITEPPSGVTNSTTTDVTNSTTTDVTNSTTTDVTNSTTTDVTNSTISDYTTATSTNVSAVATTQRADNKQTTTIASTIPTSTVNETTASPTENETTTSGEKQSTPNNVAMIVGVSVSVVVVIILMIIMLIWCIRSKKYRKMAVKAKCLSKNKKETLDNHNSLSHQKHITRFFMRSVNSQPNDYGEITCEQGMDRKLSEPNSSKDSYTSTKIDEVLSDVDSNNQYASVGVVATRTSLKLDQDDSVVSAQTVKNEFVCNQSEIPNSDHNNQTLDPSKENKLEVENILYGCVNEENISESSDGSDSCEESNQCATDEFRNDCKSQVSLQNKLDVESILYEALNTDNDVSSGGSDEKRLVVENTLYGHVVNSINDQTDFTNSQQQVDNVLYELDGCDQVSIETSRMNGQSRVEKHKETDEDSKSDIEFYEEIQINKEDDGSDEVVEYAEIDVDLKREHSASETMINSLYDSIQTNIDEAAEVKANILYDPDG